MEIRVDCINCKYCDFNGEYLYCKKQNIETGYCGWCELEEEDLDENFEQLDSLQ